MNSSAPHFLALRRYRLELEIAGRNFEPASPPGYSWEPWRPEHLAAHAAVLYESFRGHADTAIIRTLGTLEGCCELMTAIVTHPQFAPEATWLVRAASGPGGSLAPCGSVQALASFSGVGRLQNIGLTPEHRRRGLGRGLLLRSIRGLRQIGMRRVQLEVTAGNGPALALYRDLGFRRRQLLLAHPSAS